MHAVNFLGVPLPIGGEPLFFMASGAGILVEEAVKGIVRRQRGKDDAERWYDRPVGYVWTCVGALSLLSPS